MNYISQSSLIESISQKILQPKQSTYDEEYFALSYLDDYDFVDSLVYNKYNEKLKVSLFFAQKTKHETCVVYMHGFGSNRTEAIFLLKYLPTNISLCCFDFSGEGKSEGRIVTYGHKEKDDIRAILGYLRTCGYKKFILWGRSMGATCTLLFSLKQKPQDVVLQILDSPFISFQSAVLGLTRNKINAPQLLITFAIQALKLNLQTKQYNPFQIDLNKPIKCHIPTIFVYSENDEVLNPQNSKKIIRNFEGYFQKIVIKQRHNALRKSDTILQLIQIIKKHITCKSEKRIGLLDSGIKKKKPAIKKQSDQNYGIWVSSKIDQKTQKHQSNHEYFQIKQKSQESLLIQSRQVPIKRPKSSIKVYSKLQKFKDMSKFSFDTNSILASKFNYPYVKKSSIQQKQLRLSHQLYL